MIKHARGLSIVAVALAALSVRGDVKLHGLFRDNMVLQRNQVAPIWGWADDGEQIRIEFRDQIIRTTARDGKWSAKLRKLKAGGPDTLRVVGKNSITLQNVMVGEVWVASGQSNMEWPLKLSHGVEQEMPKIGNAMLRLYTVPKLRADKPTNNVNASWQECSAATASNFSAVGYYFGRDLQKALGVPVGIVHTSWGGSPVEVWMSGDVLSGDADYKRNIVDAYSGPREKYEAALAQFEKDEAEAKKDSKPFAKHRPGAPWKPSELYNGMIAPLPPYAIAGAIWYQGESNAGRAHEYRRLFPDMIRNWRKDWGQGSFPFLLVQLAPFLAIKDQPAESAWAELREAQLLSTKALPKVGMAVITDVGDEKDIHPRKKEPVGARLAIAARAIAYGEKIEYSGPQFQSMKTKEGKAVLTFEHTGGGLQAKGGDLKGFAIAGEDKHFVWAKAEIEGDKIVVSSAEVSKPEAVRYGWADYPAGNLWNKDGLPASPFRTDDFPMSTAPKPAIASAK